MKSVNLYKLNSGSVARIKEIVDFIPKAKGMKGSFEITKEQLSLVKDFPLRDALYELMDRKEGTVLQIMYKAKSNYAIASMKIKEGKKILGSGYISVSDAEKETANVKSKLMINSQNYVKEKFAKENIMDFIQKKIEIIVLQLRKTIQENISLKKEKEREKMTFSEIIRQMGI